MYSHKNKLTLLLVAMSFFMLAFSKAQAQSPQVLLVVGNANTVSADDQALIDRMSNNLGYQVNLLDDNQVASAPDFSGNNLIVISHTINPGFLGTEFTKIAIPVFCSNFLMFDDLDMANSPSRGASKTEVNIIDPIHPLADGHNGNLVIYDSPRYMGFGNPSPNAAKVAIMGNKQTRATIFGYETGSTMLSIAAPARRVGFFLSNQGSAQALTTDGWELFDASICWALGGSCGGSIPTNIPPVAQISTSGSTTGMAPFTLNLDGSSSSDSDGSIVSRVWNDGNGNSQLSGTTFSPTYQTAGSYTVSLTVTDDDGASHTTSLAVVVSAANNSPSSGEILFIVGNANNLSLDDQALELRMTQENGKTVTVVDDNNHGSANVTDFDAIVVSHTVNANVISNAFQNTAVPVFMMKWLLHDENRLAIRNTRANNQTHITIQDSNHPVSNGHSGSVQVYDTPSYMGYATPGLGADLISILGNRTSRATIFTYEANATMVTGTAPAKRAGFFISGEGDVRKLTEDGWGFFDAIIEWITPNVPILPISACYQPPIQWAAPSIGVNRIINRTFRKPVTDASQATLARDVQESVTYIDGLGKNMQNHLIQAMPDLSDQVSFMEYDDFGRNPLKYLPFGMSNNSGALINNPKANQQNFYNLNFPSYATQVLFGETDFERSPLNRPLEQGAEGNAWKIDKVGGQSTKQGNTLQSDYRSNYFDPLNSNTNVDLVLWWQYSPLVDKFSVVAHYSNNQLSVVETRDENKSTVLEYTDKLGRIILRRVEIDGTTSFSNPQSWANTYFLYDTKGNLRHVIQPDGIVELIANGYNLNASTVKNQFLFSYKYDSRNRLIEKKIPNAEPIYYVYNQLDSVVLMQDGNLRTEGHWNATKYDAFGRPIITGLYKPTTPETRTFLQDLLDGTTTLSPPLFETRALVGNLDITSQSVDGYTNNAFPSVSDMEVNTIMYFNDYDFFLTNGSSPNYLVESQIATNQAVDRNIGLETGVKIRVLGTNDWHWKTNFYDEYANIIQTQSDHQEGTDILTLQVNFAGEIIKSVEHHNGPQGQIDVVQKYCYDHEGRPIRTTHQVNQEQEIILSTLKYDLLGRPVDKKLHSKDNATSFLQSIDYNYNIRSWITGINQLEPNGQQLQTGEDVIDLFSMQLSYEDGPFAPGGNINVTPLYNGNITAIQWQDAAENDLHLYSYKYDKMNRLLSADYAAFNNVGNDWSKNVGRYNTLYSYDKNGNITNLTRHGKIGSNSYGLLDELSYSYENGVSNHLLSITDGSNNTVGVTIDQFIDGNTIGNDYEYDANGNITVDKNKNVQISYNYLNKPIQVDFLSSGNKIEYTYDATGNKLKQVVTGTSNISRDYILSYHYSNGDLDFFSNTEGRVVKEQTGKFHYEYNHLDHMGNIRLSFADLDENGQIDIQTEILQSDYYYPFGMRMGFDYNLQNSVSQRYQYNGKELQDDFELNWLDYGARMYDASIGRFNAIDPHAENYYGFSPYSYVMDNPINSIDPDGRDVIILIDVNAAQGNGHMGMLFQDGTGQWYYMTQGAVGEPNKFGLVLGLGTEGGVQIVKLQITETVEVTDDQGKPVIDEQGNPVTEERTRSMTESEAIDYAKAGSLGFNYTDTYKIKTDSKEDLRIYKAAREVMRENNNGNYNLYFNNCVDACQDAIQRKTEIDMPIDFSPKPNDYFKKLKKEGVER